MISVSVRVMLNASWQFNVVRSDFAARPSGACALADAIVNRKAVAARERFGTGLLLGEDVEGLVTVLCQLLLLKL